MNYLDLEKLLLKKSFQQLTEDEKMKVLTTISEQEYELYHVDLQCLKLVFSKKSEADLNALKRINQSIDDLSQRQQVKKKFALQAVPSWMAAAAAILLFFVGYLARNPKQIMHTQYITTIERDTVKLYQDKPAQDRFALNNKTSEKVKPSNKTMQPVVQNREEILPAYALGVYLVDFRNQNSTVKGLSYSDDTTLSKLLVTM